MVTILEIEISCSQWEGSPFTQIALIFYKKRFWWGGGEVGGRIFFHFPFVPNMFLSNSHHVTNVFPKGVPNSTSLKSHMFLPNVLPF
jgi:hypothetical protein